MGRLAWPGSCAADVYKRQETARFFAPPEADEDEDDDDKMVYVNGRLIKKSELKERNFQEHQN